MMRPSTLVAAFLAAATFGTVALAEDGFTLKTEPKAAFIYFAQKNDGGWVQAFEEARGRIEKAVGMKIPYVEDVADDDAQIRPAVEKFIQRGYNIILGTSYGYNDTFKDLAAKHPDVAFLNSPGTITTGNLQAYYGRSYESYYLCGMVAGAMAKNGKLGFVGGFPYPTVNWNVNAFAMGARQANPNATVTAVFISAWSDPAKERAAAEALIDQGAEVIGEHINGPTPELVAQEHGAYAVGFQRDKSQFAPKSVLCSSAWIWSGYVASEIEKIRAGAWKTNINGDLPGIKEGGTDAACCNAAVPEDVVKKMKSEREAIINGKPVFAGPLTDRDGKERVAAGQSLSDADLWKMDWYVKGVVTQK
jgi:basic membrane protein A and related proteins